MAAGTRKSGSGFASTTATAVEQLLASRISRDDLGARGALRVLDAQYRGEHCGIDPAVIDALITQAAAHIAPTALPADRTGHGLGDVLVGRGKDAFPIEVKAQTKKRSISDLTQADWIRDQCHTLRWLNANNTDARRLLGPDLGPEFGCPSSAFANLTFEDAWLLDVGGITDEPLAASQGLTTRAAIHEFLKLKWIVVLNESGVTLGRLCETAPVAHALAGGALQYQVTSKGKSRLSVPVWATGDGGHGRVDFTFHVYADLKQLGRHKFHGRSAAGLTHLTHSPR